MKKIRVLLIGLGRIASTLEKDPLREKPCTHTGAILSREGKKNFRIDGIWDSNPDQIKNFFQDWKAKFSVSEFPQVFSPELWKTQNFDLGIIATNSDTHGSILEFLIRTGIPHILIEKPLCLDLKQAKRIKKLSEEYGTYIWVNHERRYHPVYEFIVGELQKKTWGEIRTIHGRMLTSFRDPGDGFEKTGGGPLFHDGTHLIDLVYWILGAPKSVITKKLKGKLSSPIYDRILTWMDYPSEASVFLEIGGRRKYFQFELDIETESARIILSNDGHKMYQSKNSSLYKGFRSLQEVRFPKRTVKEESVFTNLYRRLAKEIRAGKGPKTGGIGENLEILELLFWILTGGRKGK
jgi:predicted dehydrogenase